jgi:hypothetical protein
MQVKKESFPIIILPSYDGPGKDVSCTANRQQTGPLQAARFTLQNEKHDKSEHSSEDHLSDFRSLAGCHCNCLANLYPSGPQQTVANSVAS